jgi:uncharacterized HAD superfamily protein
MIKNKTIAVDVDGTLTKTDIKNFLHKTHKQISKEYSLMKPNKILISQINELWYKNTIIIFTTRHSEYRRVTLKWLFDNKVKYHHIVFDKYYYDLLIDDKAIKFKKGDIYETRNKVSL